MQNFALHQIFRRILAFLVALLALFAGAAFWIRGVEQAVTRDIVASETVEHRVLFEGLLSLAARPLEMFIESYGRRTSFTRPGETPVANDSREARDVLAAGLRTFRVDCAWVLNADDTIRLQVFGDGEPAAPPPALPLLSERSPHLHFFFDRAGIPYELVGRRLAADGRFPANPRGWILAANRLDLAALNAPALPIDGRVAILPPGATPEKAPGSFVQIDHALPGFDGKSVATLRLFYAPDELIILGSGLRLKLVIMALFVCTVLGLLAYCLWHWVIRPASMMQGSLVTGDSARLRPLLEGGGDFSRLAGLVRDLIEHRAALRRALDERTRLDRDLHDGVIQMIYSSGMGVTRARALVRADPGAAERQLDKIHGELSAAILEVRAMLAGLAPEGVEHRGFAEVAAAIVDQTRAANSSLRVSVRIDEPLVARLSLSQRAQLLQFIREGVSNACRHAQASAIEVAFQQDGKAPRLVISDDGVGFDQKQAPAGRGLKNLAARAALLSATLAIDSAPGGGTKIILTFPSQP